MAPGLRNLGIALVIGFISAPVAIVATILLFPFWSWIESAFGIESIGHSGPDEWCYLSIYFIILTSVFFIWWATRRKVDNE